MTRPLSDKPCQYCGEAFLPKGRTVRYCCLGCAFLDKLVRQPQIGTNNTCWEWGGNISRSYGFVFYQGYTLRAHRVSLLLAGVDLGAKDYACHTCDNPPCVNPNHLYVGNDATNMADRQNRNRTARGERQSRAVGGSPRLKRGMASPTAKLTDEDVVLIRKTPQSEVPHNKMARWMGASPTLIRKVRIGEAWTHIASIPEY